MSWPVIYPLVIMKCAEPITCSLLTVNLGPFHSQQKLATRLHTQFRLILLWPRLLLIWFIDRDKGRQNVSKHSH